MTMLQIHTAPAGTHARTHARTSHAHSYAHAHSPSTGDYVHIAIEYIALQHSTRSIVVSAI